MSRKTTNASIVAIAASMMVIILSADGSGAIAQVAEPGGTIVEPATLSLTDDVVPQAATEDAARAAAIRFVSHEVVQPLAADTDDETGRSHKSLRKLVAATPVANELSEQMQCLAGAVYFESRGEPLDGQLAVAQVIINRTESGSFPKSYCGVVQQQGQFSFVSNGRMPSIRTSSAAWKNARAIAKIAHEGLWDSEAGDSLYFHAKYVRPRWARTKLARATIDSHVFYR